jgi:hypothetical protein
MYQPVSKMGSKYLGLLFIIRLLLELSTTAEATTQYARAITGALKQYYSYKSKPHLAHNSSQPTTHPPTPAQECSQLTLAKSIAH